MTTQGDTAWPQDDDTRRHSAAITRPPLMLVAPTGRSMRLGQVLSKIPKFTDRSPPRTQIGAAAHHQGPQRTSCRSTPAVAAGPSAPPRACTRPASARRDVSAHRLTPTRKRLTGHGVRQAAAARLWAKQGDPRAFAGWWSADLQRPSRTRAQFGIQVQEAACRRRLRVSPDEGAVMRKDVLRRHAL